MAGKPLTEGIIQWGELYTLEAFKKQLKLTDSSMRALRCRGMPIARIGKRAFVLAHEFIQFMEAYSDDRYTGKSNLPEDEGEVRDEVGGSGNGSDSREGGEHLEEGG